MDIHMMEPMWTQNGNKVDVCEWINETLSVTLVCVSREMLQGIQWDEMCLRCDVT